MKVTRKEAALLKKIIARWQKEGVITESEASKLRNSVTTYKTEYDAISVYAFITAISCGLLAFAALVLDEKWIERIRNFFNVSQFTIALLFTILSVVLYWISQRRLRRYPASRLANESFNVQLSLSIGVAATYFAKGMGLHYQWYAFIILIILLAYGVCAWYLKSKLLWLCMLVGIVACWGVQTYAWSDHNGHHYFLGMNYPMRMTVLGFFMIAASWRFKKIKLFNFFHNITWHFGWIFFLLSAWALSIAGNLNYEVWAAISQGRLAAWAIGYTLLLIGFIVYSFYNNDELLRDIFVIFFLLNLYTRFFEYFWDRTNKGLFFAILALSFWLIGRYAEKLRNRMNL